MKLTFVNQTTAKINTKRLTKTLVTITQSLKKRRLRNKKKLSTCQEIVFVFLTARQMQKINMQFRGKDRPTDVLSFESQDAHTLGELIFCLPVLKKQAKEHKQSLEDELTLMMIHGILHLLGYDHEASKAEDALMFQIQEFCFAQVRHQLS